MLGLMVVVMLVVVLWWRGSIHWLGVVVWPRGPVLQVHLWWSILLNGHSVVGRGWWWWHVWRGRRVPGHGATWDSVDRGRNVQGERWWSVTVRRRLSTLCFSLVVVVVAVVEDCRGLADG